jgi:transcriptional regulator with XRE-family HTH domain
MWRERRGICTLQGMKAAAKIAELLEKRGWSQSNLARAAGLNQRQVSYIIKEGREPGVKAGLAIAIALRVSPHWLWSQSSDVSPLDPSSIASFGDSELVYELARRCRLVERDICRLVASFEDDRRRTELEAIAARANAGEFNSMSPADQGKHKAAWYDLHRMAFCFNRLDALDPGKMHSPAKLPGLRNLFLSCPTLRIWLDQIEARGVSDVPDVEVAGRVYPAFIEDGTIISRQQYIERGAFGQKRFLPILSDLKHAGKARPVLIRRGQQLPDEYDEFVRFDTKPGTPFALIIVDSNMEPELPRGQLIVCEPGDPDPKKATICAVLYDRERRQGVFCVDGDELRGASPKSKRFRLKAGDRPKFFPMIGGPIAPLKGDDD